jgi:hypothetical protein
MAFITLLKVIICSCPGCTEFPAADSVRGES